MSEFMQEQFPPIVRNTAGAVSLQKIRPSFEERIRYWVKS